MSAARLAAILFCATTCVGPAASAQEPGESETVSDRTAGLVAVEQRAMAQALQAAGCYWSDLGFRKDVAPAVGKPHVVLQALSEPMNALEALSQWETAGLSSEPLGVTRYRDAAQRWSAPEPPGMPRGAAPWPVIRPDAPAAPPAVAAVLARLAPMSRLAEDYRRAFVALKVVEVDLIRSWGLRHVVAPDEAFPDFRPTYADAAAEARAREAAAGRPFEAAVLDALSRVDVEAWEHAVVWLQGFLTEVAVPLRNEAALAALVHEDPRGTVQGGIVVRYPTAFGDLVIGGPGNNRYTADDAAIIIDLGGDDTYDAPGIGGTAGTHWLSAIVDCAGNDTYRSTAPVSIGGALLGISVLIDVAGDDQYTGGLVTQGAAIAGAALLVDGGGHDRFVAERHAQGAGLGGVGVLVSGAFTQAEPGNVDDQYQVVTFGQGFARTNGVGLLLDHAGNDTYTGGGSYPYLPQAPEHTYSHCQGYAIGVREYGYAGGFGLLVDRGGNDTYRASMHAQGAACFYAMGALLDLSGDDTYEAVFNAQGAAVHEAAGFLVDGDGNDRYTLSSPAERDGLGQGCAHDFAVGVLHDRGGNDVYSARAAAQGVGLTTALGVLVDRDGADRYEGRSGHLQGAGRRNRQLPSLGVFVDGGGDDTYSTDRHAGSIWVTSDIGVGIDVGAPAAEDPPIATGGGTGSGDHQIAPNPRAPQSPELQLDPETFQRLFEVASEWDVGEARQRVRDARDDLIAWGPRVLPHVWNEIGGAWTGPRLWAIDDVLSGVSAQHRAEVGDFLVKAMNAGHPQLLVTSAMVGAHLGYDEVRPAAERLMGEAWSRRYGAVVAGLLRMGELVPQLADIARGSDENEAALAVQAMGRIGVVDAGPHLQAALGHPSFLVRDAAAHAMIHADGTTVASLIARAGDAKTDPIVANWCLQAVGWSPAKVVGGGVAGLGGFLTHANPALRGAAAEALSSAEPTGPATAVLQSHLGQERDPSVRRRVREALDRLAGHRPRRQEVHLHSGVVEYPDFFGGG